MRHIRNASFLVLLAVSLVSADPYPTCAEQGEACEQGFGGALCWTGTLYCVEGEVWLVTKCVGSYEGNPPNCWDAQSPVLWTGERYHSACT